MINYINYLPSQFGMKSPIPRTFQASARTLTPGATPAAFRKARLATSAAMPCIDSRERQRELNQSQELHAMAHCTWDTKGLRGTKGTETGRATSNGLKIRLNSGLWIHPGLHIGWVLLAFPMLCPCSTGVVEVLTRQTQRQQPQQVR